MAAKALRQSRARTLRTDRAEAASGFVARLGSADLPPGAVVKTHDYPDAIAHRPEDLRILFCFGSALESALSVHMQLDARGRRWVDGHFRNLGRAPRQDDLFRADVLGLADQLKAWCTYDGHATFCVHYDAIWDASEEISDFLGVPFVLPERQSRRDRGGIDPVLLQQARATYGPIDEVIGTLPDRFVASADFAPRLSRL